MTDAALAEPEISAQLARTPRWRYANGALTRTWRTPGWKATLLALNAVGHLAEVAWHHPEIVANFGSLEVRLSTHDAHGVTAKDFALAERIDALLDWMPRDENGPLKGAPPGDIAAAVIGRA